MAAGETYQEILTAAVKDFSEHGYDSEDRLAYWTRRLREAAERDLTPPREMQRLLDEAMRVIFDRLVGRAQMLKYHPGVERFTFERVRPQLRDEMDRRILASANLIVRNRDEAIERMLHRFSGWSTSIPPGGTRATDKRETKETIRKSLARLPFEDRRVMIDQGHKFVANLNEILATDGGAIAMEWHSHWRQRNYDYREDHKERDERVYAVRGSWAMKAGLINKGVGYTDAMTKPAEEPFCRCFGEFKYNLRDLPSEMLTAKGRGELARVRIVA